VALASSKRAIRISGNVRLHQQVQEPRKMSLASSPSRPSARGDADFDLAGLGAALWQKRYTILRPTIIVALLTLGVVLMIPPKYQSEARVLVVGRDNVYLRPDADKDLIDRGVVDQEAVTSQAQLILSRDLASEVIAKLKLNELPEFDPALGNISLTRRVLGFLGVIKNPLAMTPEERVLEAYYERLTVFPVEKSRVIVIDFLSENPELAARVANAIADAYLKRQQEAKQDQARSAGQWLSGEIDNLRKKVADSEAKVEAFRARSNLLVGPNNTTLSVQQLGDLNTQLAAARAQKADAEAKAKLIRDMLKSGEPIESSEILNSELIRRLSEQRVTLRAQLAEQSSSLLGNHPRIKELRAQIGDLDQQIRKEAEALARSLENDAKLADARVAAQLVTFNQLKKQAETSNEDDVQLRALERDAKSQRDLLESYLAKYRDASARGTLDSAPAEARIISRATPSSVPAYPKKLPTIVIASLATFMLMCGLVVTRTLLEAPGGEEARERSRSEAAAAAEQRALSRGRARWDAGREADADAAIEDDRDLQPELPFAPPIAPAARAQWRSQPEPARRNERAAKQIREAERDELIEQEGREQSGSLRARLRSVAARKPDYALPPAAPEPVAAAPPPAQPPSQPSAPLPAELIGVPVSALEDFARNLHAAGVDGSQIAVFGASPALDVDGVAIRFARALARNARVVLVALGGGDAAVNEISAAPDAPGLSSLATGQASFSAIITRDVASNLNLIAAGGNASRGSLLSAPGIMGTFEALTHAYPHLIIDGGALGGPDSDKEITAIARIATHALLLVESAAGYTTVQARDSLLAAGFDNVTILIAGPGGRGEGASRRFSSMSAAA
jgi:polysaccharide biosynthesis transport protein